MPDEEKTCEACDTATGNEKSAATTAQEDIGDVTKGPLKDSGESKESADENLDSLASEAPSAKEDSNEPKTASPKIDAEEQVECELTGQESVEKGEEPDAESDAPESAAASLNDQEEKGTMDNKPKKEAKTDYSAKLEKLNDTEDTTDQFEKEDIQGNQLMAAMSYVGFLFLVPLFAAKDSKFARYHASQGATLCIAEFLYNVGVWILRVLFAAISWRLIFIARLLKCVNALFVILAIVGIVNVSNGRAKELPVIGKYKIIK